MIMDKGLIFVISDLRGRSVFLREMLAKIEGFKLQPEDKIIMLGNYTNDGNFTYDILSMLRILKTKYKDQLILLRGGQEQVFLTSKPKYMANRSAFPVIESYRLIPNTHPFNFLKYNKIYMNKLMEDQKFVNEMPLFYEGKNFFFCPAGVDPRKSLDDQLGAALLHIGHTFLDHKKKLEKIIVHGTHFPKKLPEHKTNRINVNAALGLRRLDCHVIDDNAGKVVEQIVVEAKNA